MKVRMYHEPVLLQEVVDTLVQDEEGVYVDVTFGGGGHSKAILNKLGVKARLIGFDRDQDSLANVIDDNRVELVSQNFLYMKNFLRYLEAIPVNGILADLGVSSHQFDVPDRGFSFRSDHELDMRMDQSQALSARDVVGGYSEKQLTELIAKHSDLSGPGKIAGTICRARVQKEIRTTHDLMDVFDDWGLSRNRNKFFSQLFQAIRMEVNDELGALRQLLTQAGEVLAPGGRIVVISYHSMEDRMVKNFFRYGSFDGPTETDIFGKRDTAFKPLAQKVTVPSQEEVDRNPRARSAKMRTGVRL